MGEGKNLFSHEKKFFPSPNILSDKRKEQSAQDCGAEDDIGGSEFEAGDCKAGEGGDDGSGERFYYRGDEILLLSGLILGDGNIDLIAKVKYGTTSDKIENRLYSESSVCISSESIGEYSGQNSYYGMLATRLAEKYHESFIILKDTLK